MAQSSTAGRRAACSALAVSALGLAVAGLGQGMADAAVSAVQGSAFNCSGQNNLFGQPQPATEPTASVTLPPGGSGPITQTAVCDFRAFSGGPPILSTGPITVSTQGTTGLTGSVTSTATATDVGVDPNEPLQAASISSTCTATESGVTGSTTVVNGTVVTNRDAGTVAMVPQSPTPGFSISGVNGAAATYRFVFNEQSTAADGTLTVNAVHLFFTGGPVTGDVILGQVVCDVTAVAGPTTTVASTTTVAPTTTAGPTTTVAPTSTTGGSTSTTTGGTTSTTVVNDRLCRGLVPTIVGTPGDDNIDGTSGDDVIVGLAGNDRIRGLGGSDVICGGDGDDRLVGGSGADILSGGDGNDFIAGDAGKDRLVGDDGDDALRGGGGDDELDGRDGTDDCRGGLGTDDLLRCESD